MKHEPKRIIPAAVISLLWAIAVWSRAFNPGYDLRMNCFLFLMIAITAAASYIFIFRISIEILCNYLQKNKNNA